MKIAKIELGFPTNYVTNEYYLNRFPENKEMLNKMFTAMNKEGRYIATKGEENSLTLGIKAVERVLEGVNAEDIGAIYFTSQTPEYTFPTNAILIHQHFKLNKKCLCLDMNGNCAGMTLGLEQAHNYLKYHKECKYVLLVGAECHSTQSPKDDVATYPIFGDMGCAVLLENTEEDFPLKSFYYANSKNADKTLFPKNGLSSIHDEGLDNRIMWFNGGTLEGAFGPAIKPIKDMMEELNITTDDISFLTCNQQTKTTTDFLVENLGIPREKTYYIGNRFGYTGSTASFVSLYCALQENRVAKGGYLVIVSAGAGGLLSSIIMKME